MDPQTSASNICLNGLYYKLMSISLLYLHLDLTSLYLRKRTLWGQTEISLLSWCSACPGAVRHGGACGPEGGAGVGRGRTPTSNVSESDDVSCLMFSFALITQLINNDQN